MKRAAVAGLGGYLVFSTADGDTPFEKLKDFAEDVKDTAENTVGLGKKLLGAGGKILENTANGLEWLSQNATLAACAVLAIMVLK